MDNSWEGLKPAPLEFMHGEVQRLFHQWRKEHGQGTQASINGINLNCIVAAAKAKTYDEYPVAINRSPIKVTETPGRDPSDPVNVVEAYRVAKINERAARDAYQAAESKALIASTDMAVAITNARDKVTPVNVNSFGYNGKGVAILVGGVMVSCDFVDGMPFNIEVIDKNDEG